ncbi:MAG: hypothetical protein WKF77_31795 [Planctomycetaceae bacterium]
MWKAGLGTSIVAISLIAFGVFAFSGDPLPGGDDRLIVHEWGTFTSFSGSNGVHLDFRPLRDQDLPPFVLNRAEQSGFIWLGKIRIRTRVRMETPVTYFYTDKERTIRASVDFPEGLLTEFYPPVVSMTPPFRSDLALGGDGEPVGNSTLDWGEIDLIPLSALRPELNDRQTAEWMQQRLAESILPPAEGNHYGYARNTDSAFVHVRHQAVVAADKTEPEKIDSGSAKILPGDYIEKFLFYRGVGKFDVPVSVATDLKGNLAVANKGSQALKRMLLLNVQGDRLTYSIVPDVAPGQSIATASPKKNVSLEDLRGIMSAELTAAGLYPKESQAMVDTWTTSWFAEEGTRMFYLVPQELTDKLLPLHITPAPDETIRVMVGRVEIMSASEEKRLLAVLQDSAKVRVQKLAEQIANGTTTPIDVPMAPEFAALGRLAEPALARLREISPDRAVRDEAEILIARLKADLAAEEDQQRNSAQASR